MSSNCSCLCLFPSCNVHYWLKDIADLEIKFIVLNCYHSCPYLICTLYSKAGISEMFEGHHGPITGINCHTTPGPLDFSHLFVTSSFDWTVKLWSTKV